MRFLIFFPFFNIFPLTLFPYFFQFFLIGCSSFSNFKLLSIFFSQPFSQWFFPQPFFLQTFLFSSFFSPHLFPSYAILTSVLVQLFSTFFSLFLFCHLFFKLFRIVFQPFFETFFPTLVFVHVGIRGRVCVVCVCVWRRRFGQRLVDSMDVQFFLFFF